jgi:hypothetical protein
LLLQSLFVLVACWWCALLHGSIWILCSGGGFRICVACEWLSVYQIYLSHQLLFIVLSSTMVVVVVAANQMVTVRVVC